MVSGNEPKLDRVEHPVYGHLLTRSTLYQPLTASHGHSLGRVLRKPSQKDGHFTETTNPDMYMICRLGKGWNPRWLSEEPALLQTIRRL